MNDGNDKAPPGDGPLILVVDDEASIRRVTRRSLERAGYRVVLAESGLEAVEHYRKLQGEVAVVLTDMYMPVMNGAEMAAACESIHPSVRVVMTSGRDREDLAAIGARGFLAKPFTAETLVRAIEEALAKR